MEKIYKISEHKYLVVQLVEFPRFQFIVRQVFYDDINLANDGVYSEGDCEVTAGFNYYEFCALMDIGSQYLKTLQSTSEEVKKIVSVDGQEENAA